ncbi:MAG: HEPN domain-containing protein [Chloroflexi bacterium]|nr:MAG: HEPN domain-containing protein [Chloroflexota bacterium]
MKLLTREWVEKAEADFISAQREFRARKRPNYDATCFFAQQCIEKYIKARLQEAEIEFGKIHDLVKLLELVSTVESLWELYRPTFRPISAYAVNFRYPGESASKEEAAEVLKLCRNFRKVARTSLGLKP